MAKTKEKSEARGLRKKGYSIGRISSLLNVSKGTVSLWCRDIILTTQQKEKLRENSIEGGSQGRLIGAEKNKMKKLENIKYYESLGKKEIGAISQRDFLFAGVALYWGEGSKTENSRLAFTNSDPQAILFMYKWFKKIFGVPKRDFMPRIFINEIHKNRIDNVVAFWSKLLKLPKEQFGNPIFLKVKNKKVYDNHNQYYGVLSLRIKNSSNLKYHVLGLIQALKRAIII